MVDKKLILVVDDSLLGRVAIKNKLDSSIFDVVEATDGVQALEKIREKSPDLIFLDLLMPNLDGIGVLKALKEEGIEQNIIIVSADIQDTTKKHCFDLGATDFTNKPMDPGQMEAILTKIFED